jgi:hypothetical protein
MDTQPAFGFRDLFAHVVGDIAKAICEREGETKQQQYARSEAAAHMVMGFLPRDVIETILAGRCVMFHELTVDSVRETLRGESDATRRATRGSIVAMDKAFANNLKLLEHYQKRPAMDRRDETEARLETGTADSRGDRKLDPEAVGQIPEPTARPAAGAAPTAARANAGVVPPVAPMLNRAARRAAKLQTRMAQRTARTHSGAAGTEAVGAQGTVSEAARRLAQPGIAAKAPEASQTGALGANRDAISILDHPAAETTPARGVSHAPSGTPGAGNPEAFARVTGMVRPSEEFLAAAAAESPFDLQAKAPPWPTGGASGTLEA